MQAEAWIKSKLRDGGNLQRCPLQDREEAPRTLRSDVQHFQSAAFQLNQVRRGFRWRPWAALTMGMFTFQEVIDIRMCALITAFGVKRARQITYHITNWSCRHSQSSREKQSFSVPDSSVKLV